MWVLGSFLYLLFYTQQGPDLTLRSFKAGYPICCYSTPWNSCIKEEKHLKVRDGADELKRGWKYFGWNFRALLLECKGQFGDSLQPPALWCTSPGCIGFQQHIIGFQQFPSYLFRSAEKNGENLVCHWYISTLHFAAFSMISHVVIKHIVSSTFHLGLLDCFSNINLPCLLSPSHYKCIINKREISSMQGFLQIRLPEVKLKL